MAWTSCECGSCSSRPRLDDVTQFCIEEAVLDYIQHVDALRKSKGSTSLPQAEGMGPDPEVADAMAQARAELERVSG